MFWLVTSNTQSNCQDLLKPLIYEDWESPEFIRGWNRLKQQVEDMPATELEPFVDALAHSLFTSDDVKGNLPMLLLDPLYSALKRLMESSDDSRRSAVAAKYMALRALSSQFMAETMHSLANDDPQSLPDALLGNLETDPAAHEQQAEKEYTKAIGFLCDYLFRTRFSGVSNSTSVNLDALIPDLISIASDTQAFNPYFGVSLCKGIRNVLQSSGGEQFDDQLSSVTDIELKCVDSILRFQVRSNLSWSELLLRADLAFRELYEFRRVERASEIAALAVECGGRLWEKTTSDAKKAELADRISPLCRFLRDPNLVATWLERARGPLQAQAELSEAYGDLAHAAHYYSQIAFRTFVAAEFAQTARLYLLATFFFDKAHYCWRQCQPAQLTENKYRLFEAMGFSAGSSARRSNSTATAVKQFTDAAQYFRQAAALAWERDPKGLFGSINFYDSAAHFFWALAHAYEASLAESQGAFAFHLSRSETALTKCFSGFQNVFKAYSELLKYVLSPEPSDSEPIRASLHFNGYQTADSLVEIGTSIKKEMYNGDPRPHALALARSLIFIDPRG